MRHPILLYATTISLVLGWTCLGGGLGASELGAPGLSFQPANLACLALDLTLVWGFAFVARRLGLDRRTSPASQS